MEGKFRKFVMVVRCPKRKGGMKAGFGAFSEQPCMSCEYEEEQHLENLGVFCLYPTKR